MAHTDRMENAMSKQGDIEAAIKAFDAAEALREKRPIPTGWVDVARYAEIIGKSEVHSAELLRRLSAAGKLTRKLWQSDAGKRCYIYDFSFLALTPAKGALRLGHEPTKRNGRHKAACLAKGRAVASRKRTANAAKARNLHRA